jgi:energy-coupling factor transporter ATP-binding protein EcfA2
MAVLRMGEERRASLSQSWAGADVARLRSLALLPSNSAALQVCSQFPRTRGDRVAIYGPSGWGKSHLARLVGIRLGEEAAAYVKAESFIACPALIRTDKVLILDGCERIRFAPLARHELLVELQRRQRLRLSTMLSFTASSSSAPRRLLLGAGRGWLLAPLALPTVEEKEAVVQEMGRAMGLRMHRALRRVLAAQLRGNGHSLLSALRRLRENALDCSRAKNVLPALGVLLPFLHDENGWDVRDLVWEASQEAARRFGREPDDARRMYCWIIRHEIGLSERHAGALIARTDGQVYRLACEIEQRLGADPQVRRMAKAGRNLVLDRLQAMPGVQ